MHALAYTGSATPRSLHLGADPQNNTPVTSQPLN